MGCFGQPCARRPSRFRARLLARAWRPLLGIVSWRDLRPDPLGFGTRRGAGCNDRPHRRRGSRDAALRLRRPVRRQTPQANRPASGASAAAVDPGADPRPARNRRLCGARQGNRLYVGLAPARRRFALSAVAFGRADKRTIPRPQQRPSRPPLRWLHDRVPRQERCIQPAHSGGAGTCRTGRLPSRSASATGLRTAERSFRACDSWSRWSRVRSWSICRSPTTNRT